MIFQPELAKLILRGLKTETRRPIKNGERDCRYRPQHTYAVQRTPTGQDRRDGYKGRAKTIDGARILITDVHREQLADITTPAGSREGFANEIDFARYWMRLYDRGWPAQEEAFCPTCAGHAIVLGQPCPNDCDVGTILVDQAVTPDEIWDRYIHRHGTKVVWVIAFELEQDELRLLTPTTRPHGSELGYTTEPWNAMTEEPEAIDLARLSPNWSAGARRRHTDSRGEHLQRQEARSLARRVREATLAAGRSGRDITAHLEVIEQQLDAIEAPKAA